MNTEPTIVVLAAGQGSRYRGPSHKLEQPLGEHGSVLATTVWHAIESRLPVIVVTTEPLLAQIAQQLAKRDVVVVDEAEARRGMARSIASGVSARADAAGWLILPGDMPLVQPATMRAVASALAELPVAYAQYRGRRGHPVGFASALFSELSQLDGDDGARRVVARYPGQAVEVDDPGVLVDIDTEADLDRVRVAVGASAALPTNGG